MKIELLIIETNLAVRQNLVQRLSLDQYTVIDVDHPRKVKGFLKKNDIDVVLLGFSGLGVEGLSVLKTIKRTRPLIEVIMLNNSANISLSMKGMKLGAFEDFYMPLEIDTLVQSIEAAYLQKKENEKHKKTIFQKYQDLMSAVTFAEMGEADTALSFLSSNDQPSSGKKKNGNPEKPEEQNGTD